MNEIECETCVKRKTVYCPNHADCYDTINKPYYQNRIMLLEENKKLKEKLQQKEDIIDKAKELIQNHIKDIEKLHLRIYPKEYYDLLEILDSEGE